MKREKRGNKEFKIIPEVKMVIGKQPAKFIAEDFKYGVRYPEELIICGASTILDIDWGESLDEIEAKSYCDDRDEWNDKTGMEVCSSKLDMKNHYRLAKQYSRIYRLLQETAATVYRLCELHLKKAKAIDDDLVNHYGRMKV